jgi:hypothetical protein
MCIAVYCYQFLPAAAGACRGNPGPGVIPGAVWSCNVTLDGQWCAANGCNSSWVPSAGQLAVKCVNGLSHNSQGTCFPYSECYSVLLCICESQALQLLLERHTQCVHTHVDGKAQLSQAERKQKERISLALQTCQIWYCSCWWI